MNTYIEDLIYVPEAGRDVAFKHEIQFDPAAHKTKEAAAKALRQALIKFAVEKYDFTQELAEGEISVFSPERTMQYTGFNQWCVVWESGPFEWAIGMSMEIRGPWGYCEPYYSFDLHFPD